MNWDAIGAIAELLGAVGVIASLVYLATQIRQSRQQMRTYAHDAGEHSAGHFRESTARIVHAEPPLIRIKGPEPTLGTRRLHEARRRAI